LRTVCSVGVHRRHYTCHNHWGGNPPLNHGRAAVTPTNGARQRRLYLTSCSPLPPPFTAGTPIRTPTEHPGTQLPSTTHSHPPHGMSANFLKLCSRNIPLKVEGTNSWNADCESKTWRFTYNSLGLPPTHSLLVYLFRGARRRRALARRRRALTGSDQSYADRYPRCHE